MNLENVKNRVWDQDKVRIKDHTQNQVMEQIWHLWSKIANQEIRNHLWQSL